MSSIARPVSRRAALAGLGAGALGLAFAERALAVLAQEASPVPPPAGHPAAGAWRFTNYPGEPDSDVTFDILMPDGVYVEAGNNRSVTLGIWRATGERTAELVAIGNGLIPLDDLFASGHFVAPRALFQPGDIALWRFNLEVDETGNHATSNGSAEIQNESGAIITTFPYFGFADRLTVAADAATPTA